MKKTHVAFFLLLAALCSLPLFLPRFYTYIAAIVLLTALLATSLNLAIATGASTSSTTPFSTASEPTGRP